MWMQGLARVSFWKNRRGGNNKKLMSGPPPSVCCQTRQQEGGWGSQLCDCMELFGLVLYVCDDDVYLEEGCSQLVWTDDSEICLERLTSDVTLWDLGQAFFFFFFFFPFSSEENDWFRPSRTIVNFIPLFSGFLMASPEYSTGR